MDMDSFRTPLVVLLGLGALMITGCTDSREMAYKDVEIGALHDQVGHLKGAMASKEAELAALRAQPPVVVEQPKDDGLAAELAQYGAEVTWRNGELVIAIENTVLFRPGSAKLSTGSQRTLDKVASIIKRKYPSQFVRVEGHTDSQPIRRTKDKWEDNWHLSGARARAVLHYLIERAGLKKKKSSFAGYSFMRPRASNADKKGQARNRRVEIVVLPQRPPSN
jgi:chemotaxis protein MotB